ncbi:MAG TPA: hypothetical protein VF613_12700 [Longimicrobium sp.]|jgi:hypothetical protein
MSKPQPKKERPRFRICILLIALLCAGAPRPSPAQTSPARPSPAQPVPREGCDSAGFKPEVYAHLLQRQFSSVVSTQSGAVLSNFAAIDLKDGQASFAGTTILGGGVVLATKVSGGATDGLVPILRGSEFNAGVGVGAQLHLLSRKNSPSFRRLGTWIVYDTDTCHRYEATVAAADRDTLYRALERKGGFLQKTRELDLIRFGRRLATLRTERDTLAITKVDIPVARLRSDSLSVEIEKAVFDSASRAAQVIPGPETQQANALRRRNQILERARDSLKLVGFNMGWISLEYRVDNVGFRLFDPTAAIEVQVSKQSFATHSAGVRYSRYHFSSAAYETDFWSVSALVSRGHNLAELSKSEITDRSSFVSGSTERIAERKYTVHTGDYRRGVTTLTLAGDYYRFLFNRNQGAVHVYPSVALQDGGPTVYNAGFGFLITARKSAQDASVLNAELFYDLTDLTNARDSEDDLFERSGIGLRLSFPITFRPEL